MTVINFTPAITKDFILKHISEEEIFEAYGVPVVAHRFCSPLRTDHHPTCRFYRRRSNGKLIMRDLTGHFWGDCFDLVQHSTRLGYYDSLRDVAKKFGIITGEVAEITRVPIVHKVQIKALECEIRVKRMDWTPAHIAYWKQYHITKKTIEHYKVAPIEQSWLNDQSAFWYHAEKEIAFCYHFGDYDYKLYFPTRPRTGDRSRFIHNNPNIIQGWEQLPERGKGIVFTKSLKDVMCLHEFGVPAIAPMSESQIISEPLYEELVSRFERVFSLYDTDKIGVKSMKAMRKMGVQPLFFKRNQPKDFSDFVKAYGKDDAAILVDYITSLFF